MTANTKEQLFYSFERGVVTTPKFIENYNKNYPWLYQGKDNLYSNELLRLYLDSSSLHSAILKTKADMIAGNGFDKENIGINAKTFIKNMFGDESLDQVAYKCGFDLAMYGGFYLNLVWSRDREKISAIYHLPYEKVRIKKPDVNNDDKVSEYYISRDWEYVRREENKPKEVPAFDVLNKDEHPSQILFVKQYNPGCEWYSLPEYTSTLNWIKLAYEINVYHLKSVQNNMNSGLIIVNKSGIPPQEMREQIYQDLKARYAGADAAGDILMVYAENADKAPEFIPFPNNGSDQRFKDLMDQVNQNIMLGHGANSVVAGIETAGKLGSAGEIDEQYNAFQVKKISPLQKIIEDTFNRIGDFNGITDDLKLIKFKPFDFDKQDAAIIKTDTNKQ